MAKPSLRTHRRRHRRVARHRPGGGVGPGRGRARMSSRWRGRSADWRNSTTRSRPPADRRRWFRSTSRIFRRSTGSARRSTSAGAGSTCSSATPAYSARSRRSRISSREVFEEVMAVNVTANWRLIRSLDPAPPPVRRRAGALPHLGRGASLPPLSGAAYSSSKAALEALARTWAAEVAQTSLRVNLLDPGRLRTRMRAQAMPGEDPETLMPPEAVTADIVRMLSPSYTENGTLFEFPAGTTTRMIA